MPVHAFHLYRFPNTQTGGCGWTDWCCFTRRKWCCYIKSTLFNQVYHSNQTGLVRAKPEKWSALASQSLSFSHFWHQSVSACTLHPGEELQVVVTHCTLGTLPTLLGRVVLSLPSRPSSITDCIRLTALSVGGELSLPAVRVSWESVRSPHSLV